MEGYCDEIAIVEINGVSEEVRCASPIKDGEHFWESHAARIYW